MRLRKLFWLLVFSLNFAPFSFTQEAITGSILDAQSGAPVPFATIGIKNKNIGVVSNLEGDFQIPILYQTQGDTLLISCIGYVNLEVPLATLIRDQINAILLRKTGYALPEAVVESKKRRPPTANQLVRRAIRNIPNNCPQSPFAYLGYYRDYQKKDGQYINLNEAIVEIFDQGFQTKDLDGTQMKLYDYLLNRDFPINDTFAIAYDNKVEKFVPNAELTPFGGNELSILLMHDALRNHVVHSYSFVDTFDVNFINNHIFTLAEPITFGALVLNCVTFTGRPPILGPKFEVEGKLYIESENYAIHKLVYTVYDQYEGARRLLYEIQLEYARINGLMYLNYISFNNLFYLAKPPLFKVEDINIDTTIYNGHVMTTESGNGIEVTLSRSPERSSAMNKDNYTIKLGNRKLDIRLITVGPRSVTIYLYAADIQPIIDNAKWLVSEFQIEFGDIYDRDHNKLNEPEYVEVRQYRELFRQKVTTQPAPPDPLLLMNKDTTLSANFEWQVPAGNAGEYWMNTPLKQ